LTNGCGGLILVRTSSTDLKEMTKIREWHPVFAKGPDGALVGIRDVASGLKCKCTCGKCGNPVVAHKGLKNAWHFQHHAKSNCSPSPESELHLFAKEMLADRKSLWLPEGRAEIRGKSEQIFKEGQCSFVSAEIELTDGDVTPDLVLTTKDGRKLHVEIYVRHKCDEAKITKLKVRGLDAIEIDLSHINWDDNPGDWIDPILQSAPRKWLHNQKVSAFEREQADAFQKKVRRLCEALAIACENRLEPNAFLEIELSTVWESGRYSLVDHEIEGDSCFLVERKFWQARLVNYLFLGSDVLERKVFQTHEAVSLLNDYVGTDLSGFVHKEIVSAVRAEYPEYQTPWHVVDRYLRHLREKHSYLDQPNSKTWKPSAKGCRRL
jgi:Competence protein CoiA-like family